MAVVGPVGSGKSSLLSAFLGETEKLEGKVALKVTCQATPPTAYLSGTFEIHRYCSSGHTSTNPDLTTLFEH